MSGSSPSPPMIPTQEYLFSVQEPHVNQAPLPGSSSARQMTAGSGQRLLPLLDLYAQNSSCWKTLLVSCLSTTEWNSTVCFLNWKHSVTPQGRLLFRLVPSMPDTDEIGSGLWPTPTVQDAAKATRRFRE